MRARTVVAALILLAVAFAPVASAHAEKVSSDPAAGARLDSAPTTVRVVLSEPVDASGTGIKVVDKDGKQVDNRDSAVSGDDQPVLTASLPADLPDGAYRILWHALAKDTHATSGTVGFSVGAFEPPDSSKGSYGIHWPTALGRALAYLGLAIGLGAATFLLWMPGLAGRLPRHVLGQAFAVGASAHFAGAAWLLEDHATSLGQPFAVLVHTQAGSVMAVRVLLALCAAALAALALLPRAQNRTAVPVAAGLLLLAGLSSALLGHAVLHGVPGIAADAMHLLASALWAGGLLVFLWTLASAPGLGLAAADVQALGKRFGTLALACVLVLFAAGTAASLFVAGLPALLHPFRMLGSAWGRFLAAKVGLALVMVGLAAVNRYGFLESPTAHGLAGRVQAWMARFGPAFRPLSDQPSAAGFRRTLAVEAFLGATVLVLAGFLASISPPAAALGAAHGLELHGDGASYRYVLTIDPAPRAGTTSGLRMFIEDASTGQAVTTNTCGRDSCVTIALGDPANPDQGTEQHVLQPDGLGAWAASGILWTRSGDHFADIEVQTADVFQDNATVVFTVA